MLHIEMYMGPIGASLGDIRTFGSPWSHGHFACDRSHRSRVSDASKPRSWTTRCAKQPLPLRRWTPFNLSSCISFKCDRIDMASLYSAELCKCRIHRQIQHHGHILLRSQWNATSEKSTTCDTTCDILCRLMKNLTV
jgi:hypothetical protein